ncbi:MAG: hypothetical protein E6Q83_00335 [Thiothrix sp.]|nr:MAG: hypothetical protein E6Q83_00335 [Thiothrix sp.]
MVANNLTTNNPSSSTNEIELRTLIKVLLKFKKTILYVSVLCLIASFVYALLLTPVYKARTSFLPPTLGDVAPLKIPTFGEQLSPEKNEDLIKKIYLNFETNLNSLKLRREIFDKMKLLSILKKDISDDTNIDVVFSSFNEKFLIERPSSKKDALTIPILTLTLKGSDPKLIADILNQLSAKVLDTTEQEVIRDVMEQVTFRKDQLNREINELRAKAERQKQDTIIKLQETDKIEREKLEDQINTLRESAKTKRYDQITTLTEAAKIAESIGLIEKSALLENNALVNNERNAFYTEVNTQPQPLYLRGSKALRSEIKELTERTSDDPFIPGLRDLQDKVELFKTNRQVEALKARTSNDAFIETLRDKESELAVLEAFKIAPNQVSVATLDQAAFPPEKRESPKRAKIVALGAFGGLVLGILAAFMVNFWQSMRLEDKGQA